METNVKTYMMYQRVHSDLAVVSMAVESHQVYRELPALLRHMSSRNGIQKYDLGIVEGGEGDKRKDAQILWETGLVEKMVDRFYDPLSRGAFDLFRTKFPADTLSLVAAKYVAAWALYAEQEKYSIEAMDYEFSKVFAGVFPNYIDVVVPGLERLKLVYGPRYEKKQLEYARMNIALTNEQSVPLLYEELEKAKGNVFVYCGSEHKPVVDEVLGRLRK